MRILAATDFSTRSQRALRRAGLLARTHGAELTLAHVVEDDHPAALVERDRREAERVLGEQRDGLAELRGLGASVVIVAGDAFDGILRAAEACSADLIVMGAHRKQLLRYIFGTTIERVIRTGAYPVLMVNTEAAHPYARLIAATDTSEPSAHAIKKAQALGMIDGASLTLVYGFSAMVKGIAFANAETEQIGAFVAEERARADAELTAFLQAHGLADNGWRRRITESSAIAAITEAVQVVAPDLVVIGTRGRSALTTALLGSVTEEVLRSIEVDILAVPPPR
jgi:universal stress protein E